MEDVESEEEWTADGAEGQGFGEERVGAAVEDVESGEEWTADGSDGRGFGEERPGAVVEGVGFGKERDFARLGYHNFRMKKRITRVAPLRLAIVLSTLAGTLGLMAVPFIVGFGMIVIPTEERPDALVWLILGALFRPFLLSVGGLCVGLAIGWMYNLVAGWTRGIEITLEDVERPAPESSGEK